MGQVVKEFDIVHRCQLHSKGRALESDPFIAGFNIHFFKKRKSIDVFAINSSPLSLLEDVSSVHGNAFRALAGGWFICYMAQHFPPAYIFRQI